MTSGLQTYDLPDQGYYKTDQGAEVSVVQLTQSNLPKSDNNLTQNDTVNISALFNKNHVQYRLSAGDVLSIQLWAYPEITPPIQDAANVKAVGDRKSVV